MAIVFGDLIPGSHGPIMVGGCEPALRRVRFWQVRGEGEIVGKNGGRSLMVAIILHDNWTSVNDLVTFKRTLNGLVGKNDTLEELGNVTQSFKDCTFEGFEALALPGQDFPGPLPPEGNFLLDANSGARDTGWFEQVLLRFRQLVVPER